MPARDGALLARSSADGSLEQSSTTAKGLTTTPAYAGASADGSQVLFEAKAKLPCCDEALAGKSNLYLWDRASNQISLVSVLNDEKSPAAAPSPDPMTGCRPRALPLIADLGGSARDYYTQDEHAISADGELYFTAAGSGALYLRTQPQPRPRARSTAKANAPTPPLPAPCWSRPPNAPPPDPLGSRPAAFMAASADGKTAFFASPEKLTEDANTGPEQPNRRRSSAPTSTATPIEDELLPIIASGIAVDAEHVYWVNPVGGAIGRSELDGENPNPTFIAIPPLKVENPEGEDEEVPAKPQYVAVDAGHVYWTSEGEGKDGEGTIGRADIDGNPTASKPNASKGRAGRRGSRSTHAYLLGQCGRDGSTADGSIGRAKLDCGEVNQVFIPTRHRERPEGVAVDASHVYWTHERPSSNFARCGGTISPTARTRLHFIGAERRAARHRRRRRPRLLGEPGRRSDRRGARLLESHARIPNRENSSKPAASRKAWLSTPPPPLVGQRRDRAQPRQRPLPLRPEAKS